MTNKLSSPSPLSAREAWILNRTEEILASGWTKRHLAEKRAAREWRLQSPQHKAALKRNAAMAAARVARFNELPTTDAVWKSLEARP